MGAADWVTLPQHFKRSGWLTLGLGKTFHATEDRASFHNAVLPYFPFEYQARAAGNAAWKGAGL